MLLDKPPALNAKPMLCLKMVLPSISVTQKGKCFEILAPSGEAIIATRFNERNEESQDVEIREYDKYTFEAESEEVAAQWAEALMDEFGELQDSSHDLDGRGSIEDKGCDNLNGPTEQADDLRRFASVLMVDIVSSACNQVGHAFADSAFAFTGQEEMEELIAESRLVIASECLAAAEYENARVAYSAALQLSPTGPRAQEAKRGLDEAEKGIKLERAAVEIAPIVDNYRQSLADESVDEATSDPVLEVQQAMNSVLGVEPSASSPRVQLQLRRFLCVRKAGVTATLEYEPDNPNMVAYYMEGEIVEAIDVRASASGKTRFLTPKGWCSVVSESGVTLFQAIEIAKGSDSVEDDNLQASTHAEQLQAMEAQIEALTEENKRLRMQLEQERQSTNSSAVS